MPGIWLRTHRAATAVYMFDRLLTFSSEIEHVWCRKKSVITWVYIGMHLCTFVLFVANIAGWLDNSPCMVSVQKVFHSYGRLTNTSQRYVCFSFDVLRHAHSALLQRVWADGDK